MPVLRGEICRDQVHEPRNRKMWRIFLGVAGAFGMFACGMWAIHTVQTRQDIFPTSIYFRVDPVEREVSFDHFHIIGLRLDVTNAALNGTSRYDEAARTGDTMRFS